MRRKNDSFDSTKTTSSTLYSLLQNALSKISKKYQDNEGQILELWPQVVMGTLASMTKAKKFEEGKLYISVANTTALSIVNTPKMKQEIIKAYTQLAPEFQIREIYFRIGV